MDTDAVYSSLGKLTEEMYMSLAKEQSSRMQEQLLKYHSVAGDKISRMVREIGRCSSGEILSEYRKKFQILYDDFSFMKNDINSKYKIYLRGCGNAGKSTLLNALLSLKEEEGSRMSRLPKTFIVDIYTDELNTYEAQVRTIGTDGKGEYKKVTRSEAIAMEDDEERLFSESKEKCRAEIEEKCINVHLEQEREDIERDVYLNGLIKTSIREIKWGIGTNRFFHNCMLIDTPGLSQELRFTNVIEDVKSYEVDGIIWVISSESLAKQEVIDAYQKEMKEMQEIYDGRRVIAVVNMYGTGSDYEYGSSIWKRYEKKARKIYCDKFGFDDLICVNAKLAYDGSVNGDQEAVDKSNISELRKVINEMFVERSTETYHYDKLAKIDNFLSNLYRETARAEREIEKQKLDYDDKKNKIENQVIACKNLFAEDRDMILKKHLTEIRSRIAKNKDAIQVLDQRSETEKNRFVSQEIVHSDELQADLQRMMDNSGSKIYSRFRDQQRRSIISGFKTEEYVVKHFEKAQSNLKLIGTSSGSSFQYKMSGWEVASSVFEGIFGHNDVTKAIRGILTFVKNIIKNPQDRLYENIKRDLIRWAEQADISETIDAYERICMDTLNSSMRQTCGEYSDVKGLLPKIHSFNMDKPHMTWKKVGLDELLGGESYGTV